MKPMDEDTIMALKGSIAKWQGIVEGKIDDRGKGRTILPHSPTPTRLAEGIPQVTREWTTLRRNNRQARINGKKRPEYVGTTPLGKRKRKAGPSPLPTHNTSPDGHDPLVKLSTRLALFHFFSQRNVAHLQVTLPKAKDKA